MTFKEFLAELETDLRSFADSGDIDPISIKLIVINELKRFGLNICPLKEKVLDISNSSARLPQYFKSLRLALKVKPHGHYIHDAHDSVTSNYIYRERIENPAYYDQISGQYITTCDPKIITETITIENSNVDWYYGNIQPLSLTRGISKEGLAVDCINLNKSIRDSYPHQINITGQTLNTNFSEGTVYIQYYSLPVDEDGNPEIPEMTTGDIYHYIMNVCKVKIAEDLIGNNKNPQGLSQLYSVWKQEQRELKRAALVESKFYGLPKNWHKRMKIKNQQIFASYAK